MYNCKALAAAVPELMHARGSAAAVLRADLDEGARAFRELFQKKIAKRIHRFVKGPEGDSALPFFCNFCDTCHLNRKSL